MIAIDTIRIGNKNIFSITLDNSQKLDRVAWGMMDNNHITGLIPAHLIMKDEQCTIQYETENETRIDEILEKDYGQILHILRKLAENILIVKEYMIEEEMLLLDNRYIAVSPDLSQVQMVCVPVFNEEGVAFREYALRLLDRGRLKRIVKPEMVDDIFFCLEEEIFSIRKFANLLGNIDILSSLSTETKNSNVIDSDSVVLGRANRTKASSKTEKIVLGQSDRVHTKIEKIILGENERKIMTTADASDNVAVEKEEVKSDVKEVDHESNKKECVSEENKSQDIDINNGENQPEDIVLSQGYDFDENTEDFLDEEDLEGTVYLNTETGILEQKSTGEQIIINKPIFNLGRSKKDNDFVVTGNLAVGRNHARIEKIGDMFMLLDLGSKNYTYLNGERLESNRSYRIENGAEIRLANEEFQFYIKK